VPHAWKILIVEDEEIFADNLSSYCSRSGWDSVVAGTGRLAVAVATDFLPELILLDYRLPDMDGFEILAAIRAGRHHCGCILMTGHPADMVWAGAERHGIACILYKPFSLVDLEAALLVTGSEFSAASSGAGRTP
jgi:DNA-binding response OmpR family regulator